MPRSSTFALLTLALSLACGLPRDADGTLDRVTRGTMRVGFVVDTPWVTDSGGVAGGVEAGLANGIARSVNARVAWARGPETRLMEALHQRQLDLVIGGLRADSPWSQKVALTREYYVDSLHQEKHVVAVAPGENAWMVAVERSLQAQKERARRALEGKTP